MAETNIFGGYHGKAGIQMTLQQFALLHTSPSSCRLNHSPHLARVVPIHPTNTSRVQIPDSPLEVLPIFRTCIDQATGRLTTRSSDSGHFGILFFVGYAPCGSARQRVHGRQCARHTNARPLLCWTNYSILIICLPRPQWGVSGPSASAARRGGKHHASQIIQY